MQNIKDFLPLGRHRIDSGQYLYRAHPFPPKLGVIEASKKAAKKNIKDKKFYATCPCCTKQTAVPSDVTWIIKTGVCGWCVNYVAGKVDHVIVHQDPLLEEVIERAKSHHGLTPLETRILLASYNEINEKSSR